jgi:HK97 gp10 family phage protein
MALEHDFTQLMGVLEELEKRVQKEISDEALREGGKILLEQQLDTAPRDTGKLRESLIVGRIKGTGAKRKVIVGINPTQYEEVKYGFYQEHGTDVMLGKKWMKRAWQSSVKDANKAVSKTLARRLGGG